MTAIKSIAHTMKEKAEKENSTVDGDTFNKVYFLPFPQTLL